MSRSSSSHQEPSRPLMYRNRPMTMMDATDEAFLDEFDRLYQIAYTSIKTPRPSTILSAPPATWFSRDIVDVIYSFAFDAVHNPGKAYAELPPELQQFKEPLRRSLDKINGHARSSRSAVTTKSSPPTTINPYQCLKNPAPITQVQCFVPRVYYPPPGTQGPSTPQIAYYATEPYDSPPVDSKGNPLFSSYDAFWASMPSRQAPRQ